MYCQNNDCILNRGEENCPGASGCAGVESAQESCINCLYEYTCNWQRAGDRPCCEEWQPEGSALEKGGAGQDCSCRHEYEKVYF